MKDEILQNEDGDKVKITFQEIPVEVDYKLDQGAWFYLQNSLEVNYGRVVGFFLMMEDYKDDSKRLYMYQVEYYKELKDGKMEMRLGTVVSDDMDTEEDKIKEKFKKIREKRIDAAIRQGEIEMGGAIAEKQTHAEKEKEIATEIKRLKSLKK